MNSLFKVRVLTVRSQNPHGRGGAIFTCAEVDEEGRRVDAKSRLTVKAPSYLLSVAVERGQIWQLSGEPQSNSIIVNGYEFDEKTVVPVTLELLKPSGEHIVTLLSEGAEFSGIGQVKARRVWDHFGNEIYQVLEQGHVEPLLSILTRPTAEQLVLGWEKLGYGVTTQWLQSVGFPVSLGKKVMAYYGSQAALKIEEDPYRLISFSGSWKVVDKLAMSRFNVAKFDIRRINGAIEEALYSGFDRGHTCLPLDTFKRRLRELLGPIDQAALHRAIEYGVLKKHFVQCAGTIHATGPYVMERIVANAIASRVTSVEPLLNQDKFLSVIANHESKVRIETNREDFSLNSAQRDALSAANSCAFVVITGGAGTGKTTVLRALFALFDEAKHEIYGMALSGRAARRIEEATGHRSQTIASHVWHYNPDAASAMAAIVVDESSMVDLTTMFQLLRPLEPGVRIVLVGDPNQLAPVGPGLILHELAEGADVPVVELKEIHRYRGKIADAATQIRKGFWPMLPIDTHQDISFVPCPDEEIIETVLTEYNADRDGSQILCAVRKSNTSGNAIINQRCQERFNAYGQPLLLWNSEFELFSEAGFRVGDPLLCTKNRRDLDIQNGSMGTLISVEPPSQDANMKSSVGKVKWDDGRLTDITPELVECLELAYAITVHKAQGSAFPRVIIPITSSKILDRTLIYTAITRAERQIIMVGNLDAAKLAVTLPPRSSKRRVALRSLLREQLSAQNAKMS